MKTVDELKDDLERVKNKISTLKVLRSGEEIFEGTIYHSLQEELAAASADLSLSIGEVNKIMNREDNADINKPYTKEDKIINRQFALSSRRYFMIKKYLINMMTKEVKYLEKLEAEGKLTKKQFKSRVDKVLDSKW